MMGLRSWRLGWVLGCLGVGLLLLTGCDSSQDADSGVSRIRIVIDRTAQTRQMPPPPELELRRLLVEVFLPENEMFITSEVVDVTDAEVAIDVVVPQGDGRRILVEAFNPFDALIFSGATIVDLFLPVHDIELELFPVFSVNVAFEAEVSADIGAQFTVAAEELGLDELFVDIPADALDRDGEVVIGTRNHPHLLPPLPPETMPMGPVLGFEAEEAELTQPITLTLPYDDFGLSMMGLGPEALRFYHLEMGGMAWSEVTIVNIDPVMVYMTVLLPEFGSGVIAVYDPRMSP